MISPRNLQEYVIGKVLEHIEERIDTVKTKDEEIKMLNLQLLKKDKEIRYMKDLLTTNKVCYECKCTRCDKFCVRLPLIDKEHFHDAVPEYPILCYNCFFYIL